MSNYAALTLLFYAILYLFQLIKGAVLENRQPYTHPPTARYDVVNLVVTKVVQITNTTDSSSDALNASEETSAFTQAASVESMTESLAHAQSGHGECRRSHCRVDVAVSGSLRRNAEEVLRDNPVRVRILLAPRIPEYGMSFDDYQLPSATPKEGLNLQYPSIYAIFYSMSIVNGCGEPNTIYDTFAASFASDALSTRVGAATAAWSAEVFNFADLPCPPPGVTLNPGQVYEPVFAPPGVPWDSLRIAHPDVFQACTVWEYSGWRDPPTALQTATEGVSGPEQPGRPHPPRLARAAPVTAYSTASAPMGTAEPSKTTARPSTTN